MAKSASNDPKRQGPRTGFGTAGTKRQMGVLEADEIAAEPTPATATTEGMPESTSDEIRRSMNVVDRLSPGDLAKVSKSVDKGTDTVAAIKNVAGKPGDFTFGPGDSVLNSNETGGKTALKNAKRRSAKKP